jgi:hypothetical protein
MMKSEILNLIPCGEGWCIETPTGMEGPMDSQQDAAIFLSLLKRVDAARHEATGDECELL